MIKVMGMIRVLLVGIGCIVIMAMYCIIKTQESKVVYIIDPNYIQSPFEAQERMKEQGFYNGKIDGIWGPESDRGFCNYMAKQSIEGE